MGSGGFSVWWESGSSRRQDVFTYDLLYDDILSILYFKMRFAKIILESILLVFNTAQFPSCRLSRFILG